MTVPVMGCDPHLDVIAASVIDPVGREIDSVMVPNSVRGWTRLERVCRRHRVQVVGIEAASGYGRGLAQSLTGSGVTVREIPTRLTARTRSVDGAGKTDPGDARAVARAAARGEGSVWADHTGLETIRVLSHRRQALVEAQTRDINQLRALLTELDPAQAAKLGRLRSRRGFTQFTQFTATGDTYREATAAVIRQLAEDCLRRLDQINTLRRQLDTVMPPAGKALMAIPGVGTITAAALLAEIAGSDGFATDAKMAAWAGVAPLDASSGRQQRHRLNPGGNRQANRAIHTIAITQHRQRDKAHHYITRRVQEGKTEKEAIRAAKRHIIRTIWKTLQTHGLT